MICHIKEIAEGVNMKKLLFLLLFGSLACSAQEIKGRYKVLSGPDEGLKIFEFNRGNFTFSSEGHMGIKMLGKGFYTSGKGNLILHYSKQKDADTSVYNILSEKTDGNTARVEVTVRDSSGNKMVGYVSLCDKNKNRLFTTLTDTNGHYRFTVFSSLSAGYLLIDFLGYSPVVIPIAKLLEQRSTISVQLREQRKVYKQDITETYRVVENSQNRLVLLSDKLGKITLIHDK